MTQPGDESDYDPERRTFAVPREGMTLASLHHETILHLQQIAKELDGIVTSVGELRDELRTQNGRLRTEEGWTKRAQGAVAVLVALGVGNAVLTFLAAS